ncbi:hypothetical protein PFICI_12157 [Pestalotiopsis fici W106-1]|uniref:Uncharacterized protein n=1 Tax=Pestalotiopsis fici (strain W106-1 / CGMCC3.15140) TaxID=1229662 RepID=W3WSD7_PESFW|nr:uncharacterized protein PFICI_12157 [Pestalotiopsis fici W106-1]ETS76770.1 hypothetical protein PFICI_12157 [Pestalotiopsis fici W106-1]
MTSHFKPIPLEEAAHIASYSLQPPDHPEIEIAQAKHRINLANLWNIAPGSRILELGCGQGNATAVLAHIVGTGGHVDAVDPGALDYGAPFTLSQAQDHLTKSAVGERIRWHQAEPEDFLQHTASNEQDTWDVAVLAHCIWYFATPLVLASILRALRGRVKRICVAEYAMHATEKAAVPHVLAVLARGMLEAFREESSENVRSPLTPGSIKDIAAEAGWVMSGPDSMVVPEPGLLDGKWEAGSVKSKSFLRDMTDNITDQRIRLAVQTSRDAVLIAIERLEDEPIRTMDVWVAQFKEKQ